MKKVLMALLPMIVLMMTFQVPAVYAVTKAEDIATTIMFRGYPFPGRTVSQISEQEDAGGNKTIQATCSNGVRYQIIISSAGRVTVKPLN